MKSKVIGLSQKALELYEKTPDSALAVWAIGMRLTLLGDKNNPKDFIDHYGKDAAEVVYHLEKTGWVKDNVDISEGNIKRLSEMKPADTKKEDCFDFLLKQK